MERVMTMAKKKKQEEVVIVRKELTPTVIGTLEKKESGPIIAIIWVVIFILGIVGLPFLTDWIDTKFHTPNIPPIKGNTPNNPGTPEEPNNPEEPQEIKYYDIEENLIIDFDGFQLTKIVVDPVSKTFSSRLIHLTGDTNLFLTKRYFIELYSEENTLLERFLIPVEELKDFKILNFSTASNYQIVKKIAIVKKDERDYPAVSLKLNTNNEGVLECSHNDEIFTYFFQEYNNRFLLNRVVENLTYYSSSNDYDSVLMKYTTLSASFRSVNGVEVELTPLQNGFYYEATIDYNQVSTSDASKYLTRPIYYKKNTEAKVISFELGASGYQCKAI